MTECEIKEFLKDVKKMRKAQSKYLELQHDFETSHNKSLTNPLFAKVCEAIDKLDPLERKVDETLKKHL